jgi:hypothetical protein
VPLWKEVNTPARALVASLSLVGLARGLNEGKLRTALLIVSERFLKLACNPREQRIPMPVRKHTEEFSIDRPEVDV